MSTPPSLPPPDPSSLPSPSQPPPPYERPTEALPYQAARFSLYAPLLVFILGFCTTLTPAQTDFAGLNISLAVLNLLLLIAALIASIYSLISIRRLGRPGLLGRGIGGLLINGAILLAIASLFLPMFLHSRATSQLSGHWRTTLNNIQLDLTLHPDSTFTLLTPEGTSKGTWVFLRDRNLGLAFNDDATSPNSGKKILLGKVTAQSATSLTLTTTTGTEEYTRIPVPPPP